MALTHYSQPRKRITITHSSTDYQFEDETLFCEVTLRENAASSLIMRASDYQSKNFLAKCDVGDNVKVEFKYVDKDDTYTQRFGGWITELTPSLSDAEIVEIVALGYGVALVNMVVRNRFGTQSINEAVDTIKEVLTDASEGVIPQFVHKILKTATDSGYTLTTASGGNDTIEPLATSMKYLDFAGKPAIKCIEDMMDLRRADNVPNAGCHWTIVPDGTTAYFCLGTVGNHAAPQPSGRWPTWFNTDQAGSTIEVKKDMIVSQFRKARSDANYILFTGNFVKPGNEIWTENHSGDWGDDAARVAEYDEDTIIKVNDYSLKGQWAAAGAGLDGQMYYPSGIDLNIDTSKFGTVETIPYLAFYARQKVNAGNILTGPEVRLYTSAVGNNFYQDISDLITADDKWFHISLPIGDYYAQKDEPGTRFWSENGSPLWTDIDAVGIRISCDLNGVIDFYVDGLGFNGVVTRAAYDSIKIGSNKCKIMLVRDNLAKGDSLDINDDSGQIAQLAKAELINAIATPYVGQIVIPMQETIMAGQLAHIHFGKKSDGTFRIDSDMRIIEPKHSFTDRGALTYLTLTDDVKNSLAKNPLDLYNQLVKAVGPGFQNRTRTSILAGAVDMTQTILATDYNTATWF